MFGGGFEELFGGGGFGGGGFPGMGGMPQRPKGDTTKLYKILGVDTKSSEKEIRKAYRALARKHHPDRGGDPVKFKEVQNAYDCLSDPNKRKAYDATGDPDADPRSVRGMPRKRKGKPTTFQLDIPMKQFYNGHTRKIRVTKTAICTTCDGKGGQGVRTCTLCRGRGIRIVDRQIGPGMIQRMQMQCNNCDGKGDVIPPGQRCRDCNGGTKKVSKVLSVVIEKGMKHADKVVFSEEGDEHPDHTPGDVIVVLKRKEGEDSKFKRTQDGCHLIYEHKITLLEALTGFEFYVPHLDDRVLLVQSEPDAIYKSGDIMAVREEGMPLRGNQMTRGHLYVKLEVVFPKNMATNDAKQLMNVLGAPADCKAPTDAETIIMEEVDMAAEKAAYKKLMRENPSQYDEDDEDERGGQQVGCRAQ